MIRVPKKKKSKFWYIIEYIDGLTYVNEFTHRCHPIFSIINLKIKKCAKDDSLKIKTLITLQYF